MTNRWLTGRRYILLVYGRSTTFPSDGSFRGSYSVAAGYVSFMLITYPICWALSEGSNVISPTSEMIWYGILDIFSGPVFLFLFLWYISDVDYSAFELRSGKFTAKETTVAAAKAAEAGVQA